MGSITQRGRSRGGRPVCRIAWGGSCAGIRRATEVDYDNPHGGQPHLGRFDIRSWRGRRAWKPRRHSSGHGMGWCDSAGRDDVCTCRRSDRPVASQSTGQIAVSGQSGAHSNPCPRVRWSSVGRAVTQSGVPVCPQAAEFWSRVSRHVVSSRAMGAFPPVLRVVTPPGSLRRRRGAPWSPRGAPGIAREHVGCLGPPAQPHGYEDERTPLVSPPTARAAKNGVGFSSQIRMGDLCLVASGRVTTTGARSR